MIFNFDNPWILILAPVTAAFIIITSIGLHIAPDWKKKAVVTMRIILLVLIVLCLSGPGIKTGLKKTANILLVDVSNSSIRNKTAFEQMISTSLKNKGPNDTLGIICFGNDTGVEQPLSGKPDFSRFQTKVDGSFTNIEKAMKLAASLFPKDYKKRILLMSDGKENVGDALKQAEILRQKNIVTDVMPYGSRQADDVQVKEVMLPEAMKLNERFDISVNIFSNINTKGTLKIYADRNIVSSRKIDIQEGENNFVFSAVAKKGGFITYTAEVNSSPDRVSENNRYSAFSYVEDVAKLLVIQDENKQASELLKILKSNADMKVIKPENAPTSVSELQKYDAFILSDISAEKLDDRFLSGLETCVRYQGKGLLVTGGQNSYALGGYAGTKLEEMLPVNMQVKPKKNDENLGLVIVIDESGSMDEEQYGVTKIDLAKEAAIRSTELLDSNDKVGIIGFNDDANWIVDMQTADNMGNIRNAVGTIEAEGGTMLINPLKEAYEALKKADTRYKHIILLTDGEAEKTGYDELLKNIRKDKITLSAVAVGKEADKKLMVSIAKASGGRYYETDQFTNIPITFTKETVIAKKNYINNRTFTPNIKWNSEILKGVTALPRLNGYMGTTLKDDARVVLASDEDDPVLSVRQYGLGRTMAWTSDAAGIWTKELLKWERSPVLWRNMVSYVLAKKSAQDCTLKIKHEAGNTELELTLPSSDAGIGDNARVLLISPSGKEQKASLNPSSPRTYIGKVNADELGAYVANITVNKGGQAVKSINGGLIMPYSPEFDISKKDDTAFMNKLALEGGGSVIRNAGDMFKSKISTLDGVYDMTGILLVLSIVLLLSEISIRRLNFDTIYQGIVNKLRSRAHLESAAESSTGKKAKPVKTKGEVPKPSGTDYSILLEKKRKGNKNF